MTIGGTEKPLCLSTVDRFQVDRLLRKRIQIRFGTKRSTLAGFSLPYFRLEAAAAARQAFAQKVHALFDWHREPSADEFFELPIALLAHGVKRLPAG